MTTAIRLALLAALASCAQSKPRLDSAAGTQTAAAPAAGSPEAGDAPPQLKIDRTGSVEQQLARLQDAYDRNAEAIAFLARVHAQQKEQQAEQDRETAAPDAMFAVNIAEDVKAGQVDGPAGAAVTIVKAFDFACPYCQRVAGTMEELVKEYNGKVRVVYANMIVHEPAKPAHLASCAAAKQGKYREFKSAFWQKGFLPYAEQRDPSKLGVDNIMVIARDLGLDVNKLKNDMGSPECEARIQSDMAEMMKFHVNATPTFFINGKHVNGALPKDEFKRIIDEQLKIVEQSGVPAAEYYTRVVLAKGEKQFRSKVDPKPN